MATMTIYCEMCTRGFHVNFEPCMGLEVIKRVACPNCETEHTITIAVTVQKEGES